MPLPGQKFVNGVSNYIFGTQQTVDYGNPNTVINTPAVQSQFKSAGFTIMRMPVSNGATTYADSEIDARIAACNACGCAPLIILGHDAGLSFAQHVVSYVGARGLLYELFNEPDLNPNVHGVSDYLNSWNTWIPTLRALNKNAAFGGPALGVVANFSSWIDPWLSGCKSSGVIPDFVSFHDYPCGSQPSQSVCASKAGNFANDINSLRNSHIIPTLGYALPIAITEWNIDWHSQVVSYAAASNPANASFIDTWYTNALASMVSAKLDIANQFEACGGAEGGDADLVSTNSPFNAQDGFSAMASSIQTYLGSGGGGGGSSTTITASPSTLNFTGTVGGSNPATQNVTLTNTGTLAGSWAISVSYDAASGTNAWLTSSQASGNLASGASTTIQLQAILGSLMPGTYVATVTYPTNGTTTQTVNFTVSAAGGSVTALTVYYANAASSTLSSGNKLYTINGPSPSTTPSYTTFGTGTGYVEITAQSSTQTFAGSLGSPTGNGFFLDTGTLSLSGDQFIAGNWSAVIRLNASKGPSNAQSGTLTGDIIVRVWKYNTSALTYTAITSMTLASQTLTTAFTSYTLPTTSASSVGFGAADVLYVDSWFHCTQNNNGGSTSQGIRFNRLSTDTSGFTGDPNAEVVSPGYQSSSAGNLTVSPTSLSYAGIASTTDPGTQTVTLTNTTASSGSWTSGIAYGSGSGWLSLSPSSGTLAAGASTIITVTASNLTASLSAGTYTATVTFTKGADTATLSVTLVVTNSATSIINASPSSLSFSGQVGTSPAAQTITLTNSGSTTGNWSGTISYTGGAGWLTLSPTHGSIDPATPVTVTAGVNAATLSVGNYSATLTYTLGTTTATVNVTLFVSAASGSVGLTITGVNLIRNAGIGSDTWIPRFVALGSGTASPRASDQKLQNELFRKAVSSLVAGNNPGELLVSCFIGDTEAVGVAIEEVGIFGGNGASSATNSGTLLARGLYHVSSKTNVESIQIVLDIILPPTLG